MKLKINLYLKRWELIFLSDENIVNKKGLIFRLC